MDSDNLTTYSGRALMAQPDLKKGFGAELRRRRIAQGISQERLAELSDLHRTYISAVETGKRNLTIESIQRLAIALGATVATVFSSIEGEAQAQAANPNHFQAEPSNALRPGGMILLVEDDAKDIEYTLAAFTAARLANPVQVVRDGAAALEYLLGPPARGKNAERQLPQIVLLDLQLPKVHGLEVLRRLKANRRTANLPVVVLTASQSHVDVAEAMRLGASAYLTKPVDFQRLAKITPKLAFRWALL